jgi:hypothetical protein
MESKNKTSDGATRATVHPNFSPADVEILTGNCDAPPALIKAACCLLQLVQEEGGSRGRFPDSEGDYSTSANSTRAAFRVCRAALDFLEADYVAQEAEFLHFLRDQVAAYEAMQTPVSVTPAPSSAARAVWRMEWQSERDELQADLALLIEARPSTKVCAEIQRIQRRLSELHLALGNDTTL